MIKNCEVKNLKERKKVTVRKKKMKMECSVRKSNRSKKETISF